MKYTPKSNKSFLWQALLASTLLTVISTPAFSLTNISASTDTDATPSANGYNIKADNVVLTVIAGDDVNFTNILGDDVAVDNNTGVSNTPFANTGIIFDGTSIVTGIIGFSNPVDDITVKGAGSTVVFNGAVLLSSGTTLTADATIVYGPQSPGYNSVHEGFIDNTAGSGKGVIEVESSGDITGSIGSTNPFKLIILNSSAPNTNALINLLGAEINADTIRLNDNGTNTVTLNFDNPIGKITANITTDSNNLNSLGFTDADSITGNIGTNTALFANVYVGKNDDLQVNGNIFATNTIFQGNHSLILFDGGIITGNVSTQTASTGILEFLGNGGVTGTIGAILPINQVILNGAGSKVDLGGNVAVTNGINFAGASNTTSMLSIADGVTITGSISNKTALSAGIVDFAGSGTVTGTTGALAGTQAINTINLHGAAGEVVYLKGDVNVGPGNLNFAAGSTPTSVLRLADTVDVTGNIDNTTGVAGIGTVNFDDDGSVSGTIGATKSLNIINLNNAGTVLFSGNVTANVTNISAAGIAKYADNVIVTGAIDNTGAANTGTVNFVGSGQVTGNVGNTNPLSAFNINTGLAASELVELNGAVVKAQTIRVNDNNTAGQGSTLKLNNAAMVLTTQGAGGLVPFSTDRDILDIYSASLVDSDIGTAAKVFNLVKVAQTGNTTINGDIYATTTQFNGNNTLTLTDNSDINGNVTTTANNQGILQLLGTTDISGTVGSLGLALNAINFLGDSTDKLNISNNTFVNNINIANDGKVIIEDGANFTGNIDNTSGTTSKGTLEFEGTGSVEGNIGSSNLLKVINVNTLAGAGETVTLTGNVVRATEIDVYGASTTLKLNNPVMVVSTTNGIQSKVASSNTLDINNALLINSDIGTAGAFNLIKVGAIGPTTINGDIVATTTQFQADNLLTLTDGSNVTGKIDSLVAGQGKLLLLGDHTITGTIGATNALNFINVAGAGKTVNFQGDVKAGSVNFSGLANCATTINLANGIDITGNVDNTTGSASAGTLNFAGDGSVSGTIGATNALCQINLQGPAGKIVTFGDDVKVGSGNINFLQDSQLNLASGANITGNIDTDAASQGTVNFLGTSSVNGILGVSNDLKLVQLSGVGLVSFFQNVNTDELRFAADSFAILANGVSVSGPITTTVAGNGTLILTGNFTVNQQIGAPGKQLKLVRHLGAAGTTVDVFEDIYANNIDIFAGGLLSVKDVVTFGGNANVTNGTLAVAANAAPLTITGNLTVPAGSTLQFDLSSVNIPTYIKVNNAAFIDANSTVVLTNTPQAYAAGNYDIKLVDATALGNINVPLNVNGDSLLLTFELEAQNAPNNDLLLHIDVNPASMFADRINTRGVAGALDAMAGQDFGGTLQLLLDQLPYFSTQEQLNDALAALAPIVDNSFTQETFAAQELGYGAVSDRLRHVRQRKVIPGMKAPFETGFSSGDDWDDNGHGRWFKLYGQYSDQNERTRVDGYNAETWGLAIGSDVSLNDLSLIGVSANLSHTYIGHDVSDSTTSLYSLQGAVYGEQDFCEWFYFNWVTSVAYNKYTTERSFNFGLLPLSPKADFIGWQFGAKGEFGYEYIYNGYHIIPNTSLYYSYLALGGYNESGAGTASQSVDAQHYAMLKGGAGVRAGYTCPYNMGDRRSLIFQPEVRFNMFYDFINDNMATTSQFTGGGPSFVTVGPTPAPTSYNVGASLSVFSDFSHYIITMSYDYETKSDYTANAGFLRMRYEW